MIKLYLYLYILSMIILSDCLRAQSYLVTAANMKQFSDSPHNSLSKAKSRPFLNGIISPVGT
jgi:hypothetical protein